MAVRRPVYIGRAVVFDQSEDIFEYTDAFMTDMNTFAGWVHSQYPSVELVTTGTSGTLLPNQNFSDTYYVAGAYTTRVDRFSTEAETPNISMVTDTYSRIRQIQNGGTEPTGDANNLQFPLYLTGAGDLRAMSRQDFVDTFVTPVIPLIADGGTALVNGGTYFMTTSAAPTGGTILPTPAAVNSVANLAAYTSGGIPEATKQTTDINYYIAKVEYPLTDYDPIELVLPLYFDAGTEQIRMHTTASWAALLGPFLQYYMTNSEYNLNYNINGAGSNRGSLFTDSRRTPTGTGYTTRYVNTNDYRTQEFPTGTEAAIAGTSKQLRLEIGGTSSTYQAVATPSGSQDEGLSITFGLNTTNVLVGTTFNYAITGITAADISAGSLTGSVTIGSGGSGTTQITLVANDGIENETATCTFTTPAGNQAVAVAITDVVIETVSLEGTTGTPEFSTAIPVSDGSVELGWRFSSNGTVEDYDIDRFPQLSAAGHVDWVNTSTPSTTYYIRATVDNDGTQGSASQTGQSLNTWISLASGRTFRFQDNSPTASYGYRDLTYKIEISASSTGSDAVTGPSYSLTSPQTRWVTALVATNNWKYTVYWNDVLVYEQSGYAGENTVTEITGSDGYTYTRASTPTQGRSYAVTQTIPGILATGYYRNQYEGGA